MNGVSRRRLPKRAGHHLMGTCRIGIRLKLWCSCGWKFFGDLPASQERSKFEEHYA